MDSLKLLQIEDARDEYEIRVAPGGFQVVPV